MIKRYAITAAPIGFNRHICLSIIRHRLMRPVPPEVAKRSNDLTFGVDMISLVITATEALDEAQRNPILVVLNEAVTRLQDARGTLEDLRKPAQPAAEAA